MLFTYALVELSQSCSSHQTAVSLLHATRRLLRQPVHFMRGRVRCSKWQAAVQQVWLATAQQQASSGSQRAHLRWCLLGWQAH